MRARGVTWVEQARRRRLTCGTHTHTQVNEPICVEFGKASAIDFKMDRPPSDDFKLILKNKLPPKDAQLNGSGFGVRGLLFRV